MLIGVTGGRPDPAYAPSMGAWGAGPFENDSAGDFMGDLEDGDDVAALLAGALSEAADTEGEFGHS